MAGLTAETLAIMSAMCPPHAWSLIHGHKRAAYASNTVGYGKEKGKGVLELEVETRAE